MANVLIPNHLLLVFGFSQELVLAITEQGIRLPRHLMDEYDDKDGLTTLCKRIVDPGGSVPDPTWIAPAGVVPPPPQPLIRNRGTMVTREEQKFLERLAYYIRHRQRIQRPW
jgi:hypothetical protein